MCVCALLQGERQGWKMIVFVVQSLMSYRYKDFHVELKMTKDVVGPMTNAAELLL
jgi:hypothetical protein